MRTLTTEIVRGESSGRDRESRAHRESEDTTSSDSDTYVSLYDAV